MRVGGNWDIYLADTTTDGPVRRLTDEPASDFTPALSPDRRTAIWVHVTADGKRTLRVAGAADGRGTRELFTTVPPQCAGGMYRPAWDPQNTRQLAIACQDADKRYGLYLFNTDGTLVHTYDVGQSKVDDPAFSPDGSAIAYWAGPASSFDGGEIYTIAADGRAAPKRLTKARTTGQDADPTWSPAGGEIAFRRRIDDGSTGGNFDIFLMKADGSQAHAVVTGSADDQDPSFAPFGNRLAFKSDRTDAVGNRQQGTPRVWLATKQGTGLTLLWKEGQPGEQSAPAWSPR
jgi:Tol biopolymer transport system component